MLPTQASAEKFRATPDGELGIQPGSWWRLTASDHPLRDLPAPKHGLILMAQDVRVVDGDIHTIVLHEHPMWSGRIAPSLKLLVADFLRDFAPEPDGAALREVEISEVMGRVQTLTDEMTNPPDPMLLLERQKENDQAPEGASETSTSDEPDSVPATGPAVPAALLPSQDVVEAQKAIETRIAAFEAQRDWITARTQSIQSNMNLVATYQTEKVNSTLASISKETSKAKSLLATVQTMRLFLGEDMSVTPILDGSGAEPSEPLTFMQRLLFLDEEIIINDLFEGFSDDQMEPETLTGIFSRDFSLVERMLPYPRCAALVRVRRNARRSGPQVNSLSDIFAQMNMAKADKRVHILVRDGTRLHMISADEATSRAERFFPSSAEIDSLFRHRNYLGEESREISPEDIDYTDARASHDARALFYKRFLILMWGVHERTDAFGPFMDKGGNWLSASTHSDRFRFIHDEEDALTDGRPEVQAFVNQLNKGITSGSRVLINWKQAVTSDNAPSLATDRDFGTIWKTGVEVTQKMSEVIAARDKEAIIVKAPAIRKNYRSKDRHFEGKVVISRPAALYRDRPDRMTDVELASAILCLDRCTLEDIEYYANSRAARLRYLDFAHLLNRARSILQADRAKAHEMYASLRVSDVSKETWEQALRLWRGANKWSWPGSDRQKAAVHDLARKLSNQDMIASFVKAAPEVLYGGLRGNGDIFVVQDTRRSQLPGGLPLPWLDDRSFKSLGSKVAKTTATREWTDKLRPGEVILFEDPQRSEVAREWMAPMVSVKEHRGFQEEQTEVPGWRAPGGLFSPLNARVLGEVPVSQSPRDLLAILSEEMDGKMSEILASAYKGRKIEGRRLTIPTVSTSLAVVHGIDHHNLPRSWVIDVEFDAEVLACKIGMEHEVLRHASRIYSNPHGVLANLKGQRTAFKLVVRTLDRRHPLVRAWKSDFCLSFEQNYNILRIEHEMPHDDPRIGWKEAIAGRITPRDVKATRRIDNDGWSAGNLVAAAKSLEITASREALEIIERIFQENPRG